MLKRSEQPQKELNVSGGEGLKNTLTYLPTVGAWTKFAAILNYIITALTKARPSTLQSTRAFLFDACDRTCTRQHMRKPICACYLSHA